MTNITRIASIIAFSCAIGTVGCDDPAKGKATAEVGSAKPVDSSKKAEGAKFEVVNADSKLEFVGSNVTSKHEGGFKTFSGTASLAGDKIEGGSVSFEIDMTSTYSDADGLTEHLKKADFFDVENHKTSKFVSTSIEKGGEGGTHSVTGNLTLRGQTKSVKFPATIKVDGATVTVKSEFVIKRKDYKIMYDGKADDLIKDEVVIKLDLKMKKS